MSTSASESNRDYLVRTTELPRGAFQHHIHPIVNTNHVYQFPLGDSTGLTKTAVNLCRLPAGATSTTLHWHTHADEWCYVLEADADAVLLVWEGSADSGALRKGEAVRVVPREERVKPGDFVGFKAGIPRAHTFRAGKKELVYLVGGSREELDICHYPEVGKSRILGTEAEWTFADKDVTVEKKPFQK